jgi:hypothetical protein
MNDAYNGKNNKENVHDTHTITTIEQIHMKEKRLFGNFQNQ